MSRKFSIMSAINFNKLDDEIKEYVRCNHDFDPYLFMSEDTANAIENEVQNEFGFDVEDDNSNIKLKDGAKATYTGYKVFINNDLKFGIIEIR